MVYRLSTFPPEEQLAFLDQVAAVGFRVMYDVGQQQDDCGDPKFNNTRGNETCFSDPNSPPLVKLKQSINLVKSHPALLGYCEPDTFLHLAHLAHLPPPKPKNSNIICLSYLDVNIAFRSRADSHRHLRRLLSVRCGSRVSSTSIQPDQTGRPLSRC